MNEKDFATSSTSRTNNLRRLAHPFSHLCIPVRALDSHPHPTMAAPAPAAAAHPATKLTVLISGSGTNLQALIDACASSALRDTAIVRVISNKKSAAGLARAEKAGIKTAYHNLVAGEKYLKKGEADPETIRRGREAYDADLAQLVLQDAPDIVVCVSPHPVPGARRWG